MAKFRKKPAVIEAVLWDGEKVSECPPWISEAIDKAPGTVGGIFRHDIWVEIFTLEGTTTASPGDWIIRGVKGELYPCKPDIFAATYEKADG